MRSRAPLVAVFTSAVRFEERQLLDALSRRSVPHIQVHDRAFHARLGQDPPPWDAVLNRVLSATRRLHVSRLCELWGIPVVNDSRVVATCDDKLATAFALQRAGLPVPDTSFSLHPDAGLDAVEALGYPAVLKPVNGSWGRRLARVNDRDAAEGVLAQRTPGASPQLGIVYAQRYVDKPGRDIRAIVVCDRVLAAMYRCGDHWVTSAARGAATRPCPVTPELESLVLRAASAVGGGALAVDLLETPEGGLLVNEVNSAMEFRGLVEATGVDVAGCLVEHAVRLAGTG